MSASTATAPPAPYTPPPGTIGLTRIPGLFGLLVSVAQWATGNPSRWQHAFLVLDSGQLVESSGSGARVRPLTDRTCLPVGWLWTISDTLTDQQRARVVAAGRALAGTPYSWLDYLSIGLLHLGLRNGPLGRWVLARVESSGHAICSQFVDLAYTLGGVRLFDDGRVPQDVMPSELDLLAADPKWRRNQEA